MRDEQNDSWQTIVPLCERRGNNYMAKSDQTDRDRERFERARARGALRARDGSALVSARFNPRRDTLELEFRGGGSMVIPRDLVPGITRVPAAKLAAPVVAPAGDAVSWPDLDIDIYVPGLVARAFGTRVFAAAAGRQGGHRRSKAKAAAAKLNGAKGGRPRKKLSA
jgi:hypothetical protein